MTLEQLCRAAIKARGNQRLVTRLWNAIDNMADPSPYWDCLAILCPESFRDPNNVNSIRFTY